MAAAIVVLPLIVKGDAEFGGSDGQAQGVIDECWLSAMVRAAVDAAE